MIVCLCHGVSDRTIDEAVHDGCRTVRQIGRACGAGTDCGACKRQVKAIVGESLDRRRQERRVVLAAAAGVV